MTTSFRRAVQHRLCRRLELGLVLGLVAGSLACAPEAEPVIEPPSLQPPRGVLLIVVDTLRADYVGSLGSAQGLTPHMDALAAEGLAFENAMAVSSWTRPSIASMFTGQYPTTIDVLTKKDVLDDSLDTLAERLAAAGLRSLAVSTNGNAGRSFGFEQGFEQFVTKLPKVGYPGDFKVVQADEVTKKGLELVDGLEPEEPFFLFLHYIDPHDPYLPHPGLLDEPEPPGRYSGSRSDLNLIDRGPRSERTEADLDRLRWLYAGEVKFCDLWLGKLFDGLAKRGLLEDMLVIVTSDHGEGLYDHGMRSHGTDLHVEQLHVPLIVRFPATGAPAPARVRSFVSHVDILPTILGAYGLEIPESCRGRDLGLAAREGTLEQRGSAAYSEMTFTGLDYESVTNGAEKLIRDRAYDGNKAAAFDYVVKEGDTIAILSRTFYGKLNHTRDILASNPQIIVRDVRRHQDVVLEPGSVLHMPPRRLPQNGKLEQYYRLAQDPREMSDLAHTHAGQSTKLGAWMKRFADENLAWGIDGSQVDLSELDPETIAELKALGYLGGDH